MNTNQTSSLKTILTQLEQYNQNFTYYFACLTTANFQIKALTHHFKRVTNINLSKNRSEKANANIKKLIDSAVKVNGGIIESLSTEINNLTEIITSIAKQQPKMNEIIDAVTKAKNNFTDANVRKDAVKIVAAAKKLKNNIVLCENYILPKNKAMLETRKGLQNRLQFKYNMVHYNKPEEVLA